MLAYGDAYEKLVSFFDEHPNFKWVDGTLCQKMFPFIVHQMTLGSLMEAIINQMPFVNCVVIMAGVYSTYSKWINKEIEIAKQVYSRAIDCC